MRPARAAALVDICSARIRERVAARIGRVVVEGADDDLVPLDGHREAEEVTGIEVGRHQLCLLRPGAAAAHEDVGLSGVGAEAEIVGAGADHRGVAADGHTAAEEILGRGVAGTQLHLQRPGGTAAHEYICGAGGALAVVGVAGRADDHRVPVHGDRSTELVADAAVGGGELALLRPGRTAALEHVCGALEAVAEVGADGNGVAVDRHRGAELGGPGSVAGVQLRLLCPAAAAAHEDVGSPRVRRPVVDAGRADHRGIAADGHRHTEGVVCDRIVRVKLRLLYPIGTAAFEDVRRTGVDGAVVILRGADDRGVTAEGYGDAEVVIGHRVVGRQLGLELRQRRAPGKGTSCQDQPRQSQEA